MENAKGTADMQTELARSKVGVDIKTNNALARKAEADGEATFIRETGAAKGAEVEAVGMARAKAYREQVAAIGKDQTAFVNAITALAEKNLKFVPEILVTGGSSGSLDGLAATLMKYLSAQTGPSSQETAKGAKNTGFVPPPSGTATNTAGMTSGDAKSDAKPAAKDVLSQYSSIDYAQSINEIASVTKLPDDVDNNPQVRLPEEEKRNRDGKSSAPPKKNT